MRIDTDMKKFLTLAVLAAALVFQANANQIQGGIFMSGTFGLNTPSVYHADAVTAWGPVVVLSSDGDLASAGVLSYVNMTPLLPWAFDPAAATPALWQVADLTFNLQSAQVDRTAQSGVFPARLTITGLGLLTKPGFDATPFTWSLASLDPSVGNPPRFSFTAVTAATPDNLVPDGGLTLALLGSTLLGLAGLRKKFAV